MYGINGHAVRVKGGGRRDGLLHGGCGGVGGRGWLGETTVAGERERRDREGGKLVKPWISMRTASVFFSRCGDTPQCLQTDRESWEDRGGRRRMKARRGSAHLSIDLQAIKVSVFSFLHLAASV